MQKESRANADTIHNIPARQIKGSRAGFTLTEVIVVVIIIGVLVAAAVPSMIGFIEHGKQVNRMNIARTLYLTAQNQLTKSSVEKNLKSTIAGLYYQKGENGYYTDSLDDNKIDTRNVAQLLQSDFPGEEADNKNYVHYISKPRDYAPLSDEEIELMTGAEQDEARELKSFYNLLDEIIIDKSILNDAILIEYNIKTGVVLSVFYSDALDKEQTRFEYLGADNNARNNVTGGRGVDNGYRKAAVRHQGYYGVEATGEVLPPSFKDIVNIYDGVSKPLATGSGEEKVNVLYAEFLLAKQVRADGTAEDTMPAYTFEIVNAKSSAGVISIAVENLGESGFPTSFNSSFNRRDAIYRDMITPVSIEQYGIDVSANYHRYIWVIDYVDGDTLSGQPHSIGVKYKDSEDNLMKPQNVRAKASKGSSAGVISLSLANTHFHGELSDGTREIKSARHLNNVRYAPDGRYRQTADIDMQLSDNAITNFAPVDHFNGEYYAMKTSNTQYKISNLKISTNQSNVGLFADISGEGSSIQGISLYKAEIMAADSDNIGSIVGVMNGGTVKQCNSYANITVNSNETANVGGLVGCITSGTLDQSFNAGFYNAPDQSATSDGFGSVISNGGNIGGLVGLSYGIIQNSFNNARVNVDNVSVTEDEKKLSCDPVFTSLSAKASVGGIAGYNNGGTIRNTYITNYVSRLTDFDSTYGSISGFDSGSGDLQNNYFLANGCTSITGSSEAVSAVILRTNVCGAWFTPGSAAGNDNLYRNYPYPVLKNNNPFDVPDYNWEKYTCGWEKIEEVEEVEISDTGLLYYELYDDGTVGFSGDYFAPLIPSGSTALAVNDGYVLNIAFTPSAMTVTIGTEEYTLTVTDSSTPDYTWSGNGASADSIASIVSAAIDMDGVEQKRCLLFFDNRFLESHANGKAYINFTVRILTDTVISTRFNPLFADTVGKTTDDFSVRSPRHFDNINKALNGKYSQGLNLDFAGYRKAAAFTDIMNGTLTGNSLDYSSKAVVSGIFAGDYNGNRFYMENVAAKYGVFETVDLKAEVRNMILQNAQLQVFDEKNIGIGGVAAENNGTISNCLVTGSTSVSGDYHSFTGGIAGRNFNDGIISDCTVEGTVISGKNYIGGIAGENAGTISSCTVAENTTVTGSGDVGGIAGESTNVITGCSVISSEISGGNSSNVGGMVGNNTGSVLKSGAMYSTISSDYNDVGGIAGNNAGTITDVFFLSANDVNDIPVSAPTGAACGGIVGNNDGDVSNVFYFAPAPSKKNGNITEICPIVGKGSPAMEHNSQKTCFYSAGYRYSLDAGRNWISTNYNRVHDNANVVSNTSVVLSGGGMGLVTKFIDKEWLEFAYGLSLKEWYQPTTGYPYPMPGGIAAPGHWPQTDSPTRPEQEDRANSDWANMESTSDRGRNVTFINGDFSVGSFAASDCVEIYDSAANGRRIYIDMSRISGWSTRPVGAGNTTTPANNYLIELQEPIGTSDINREYYNNYMASNYNGSYNKPLNILTSPYRYAELNAEVQGTLYQICTTTPGAEFYYSFHHATRHTNSAVSIITDQMNFYLTGVGDDDNFANDSALTLIRPCWSPRQRIATTYNTYAKTDADWGKTSLRWNPAVRNTVKYGTLGSGSTKITAGDLNYYADKFSNWPSGSTQIYLYDVWIGNTTSSTLQSLTNGYGMTFWSTSNRTLATTGYTNLANLISAAPEAATNVIGYWGISYGWKHYYGLYEVPKGQTRTEFAYQSRTADPNNGNYLDGISFKSPAFLSIDKYIKDKFNEDAKFVTLDDELTVELHVTSYGEIPADNIVITDKLAPYDKYIDFVPGSVTVKKGAMEVTNSYVTAPTDNNGQTLTIVLPAITTLAAGEILTVNFKVKVRQKVKDVAIETLLFYFKNQAEVRYIEDRQANSNFFSGYINNAKNNASEILQVYIDPIKLSKVVTPSKDGPFTVMLTVEDTLGPNSNIITRGLITDLIPAGFSVVNPPAGAVLTPNADGSTRIAIQNVNLGTEKKLDYTYTLAYTGAGYGVAHTSASADYKYQYVDGEYLLDVMLEFPNPLVGISVKTQNDVFMVDGDTTARLLNITANDNFAKVLADANYDVTPEVVLLRNSTGTTASVNGAGNYQIDTGEYTAILVKGSNRLEFTPKAGANGSYTLYYQIRLNATKTGNATFELSSEETSVTVNVAGLNNASDDISEAAASTMRVEVNDPENTDFSGENDDPDVPADTGESPGADDTDENF